MERILKYASLIYALLVFVGYINLHAYYTPFGIQIWNYLTTGELLLSFLPITLDIMFLSSLAVVGYVVWRRVVEMFRPMIPTITKVLPDTMEHWRQLYRLVFSGDFKGAIQHASTFIPLTLLFATVLFTFIVIVTMFDWKMSLFPSLKGLIWVC